MLRRVGVRGRLLLSFVGISGFAVLATTAAMYSFLQVRTLLDGITERRVPMGLGVQELSARVDRIVAQTPALLAASTPDGRLRIWSRLGTEIEEIDNLLLMLLERGLPDHALTAMQNVLDPLRSNLLSLNTLVGERIALADRKTTLLDEMLEAHEDTLAVLGPWITNVGNDVHRLRTVVDGSNLGAEQQSTAKTELITALTLLAYLQQILKEVGEIHESLVASASSERHDDLELSMLRLQWSLQSLGTLATEIDGQPRQLAVAEVERLRRLMEGEESMPALRARELTLLADGERLLDENARLSQELTGSVDALVRDTNLSIAQAVSQAHAVQTRSSVTLVLIASLSLASSVLIVWLYVGRNLLARLGALSNSMLAIAGGNLRAPLPAAGGSDEITRMAEALTVFRDTALEVEEKNLREIAEMRRRLVDAIENTSEGFAFYDSEDRLELCNTRYQEMLYPGQSGRLVPGTTFEAIIRGAAEEGLIPDAQGRVQEWVAERLDRHRNPKEPHLHQLRDGLWILISEHKTTTGGTVAVYSDITELKEREEELAEKSDELERKSATLEQLSNQLAKYLSPQIYHSIFTGRQDVKIASNRKKLTVFFSDIIGFTEAADRLESEELTYILNYYLTEMSRIALDHGATIDKYVGDGILIFFGDPETKGVKEDALACVKMAIAMRERMNHLSGVWRTSGIERPLRIRMGIHTGYCTVGNFGSEDRMDYTIIGGAVNTAARLESLAGPGEILISYETFAHVRDQIDCAEHGETEVKGIAYPVAIYRVVDLRENRDRERRRFRKAHHNMILDLDLEAMTTEERDEAVAALRRALRLLTESAAYSRPRPG